MFEGMFTVTTLLDVLASLALLFGLFFLFIGAVGIVRLPDVFNRLHAASKCSTIGLMGLLTAACLHTPTIGVISKSIMTVLFVFVSAPVGSHILAKAALRSGASLWHEKLGHQVPPQSQSQQP